MIEVKILGETETDPDVIVSAPDPENVEAHGAVVGLVLVDEAEGVEIGVDLTEQDVTDLLYGLRRFARAGGFL